MIKMNLYFDEVAVDNVYASSMKEAFEMMDKLQGFYEQNEACIDYWFNELKRFSEPQNVRLRFDLSDHETKCWKLFDDITEAYSYNYDVIDNTVIFDACISNTLDGMKKIGHNDVMLGHFECSTIEQALIEWLDTLEETNALDDENGNSPTWHPNIIEFIKSLIRKRDKIELQDVQELNEELKAKGCIFRFQLETNDSIMPHVMKTVPASKTFVSERVPIQLNDNGYDFIKSFFEKRGIELSHNNIRDIFWAKMSY